MVLRPVMATRNPGANDLSLINELYEEIETRPPAIDARKLLVEQYLGLGWTEAAADVVQELMVVRPTDADVNDWHALCNQKLRPAAVPSPVAAVKTTTPTVIPRVKIPTLSNDLDASKQELISGYKTLRARARELETGLKLLRDLYELQNLTAPCAKDIPTLNALADGLVTTVLRPPASPSARTVAQQMAASPEKAMDIAISDLSASARENMALSLSEDARRETLAKRIRAIKAALPEKLQPQASFALMHVEHEVLNRSYCVTETMLGDSIADIPRENFLVTECGYPWDMEELSQALISNGGVMRNPISKDLFTPNDIRAIVSHPSGKKLAAMQIRQDELLQGIRPKTIEQLDKLSKTILADMEDDALASRKAVDELHAYMATLPDAEQQALDELRVPARDKHTGQAFDTSIGDAVRDAQGNRICFHKCGDLLAQAAVFLRKAR